MEASIIAEFLGNLRSERLKFLTKPIATYNNTLIDYNEVSKHVRLTDARTWPDFIPTLDLASGGMFHVLPREIIHDIFSRTTIHSLLYLRTSNSTFKALVESWTPFQDAVVNAQPAVRALIATRASRLWTFTDLRPEIYSKTCYLCGEHGEILHLLKLKRVCFRCVTTDRRLLAVSSHYVRKVMGLRGLNVEKLPRLVTRAQPSSWGKPKHSAYAIDWVSAVNLAVPAQKPSAVKTRSNRQIHYISALLTNPPESENLQHSCCIHLPVLAISEKHPSPTPVRALLCAGCSYYFNYHSRLPHQAHTLYPHNPAPTEDSWTPLRAHLKTCVYAYIYFQTHLYPAYLMPTPNNPLLISNGGRNSRQDLHDALLVHDYQVVFSGSNYRHFPRHKIEITRAGNLLRVYGVENKFYFERTPIPLLDLRTKLRTVPQRTALEYELAQRLERNDPEMTEMLDPGQDYRFDSWTRNQLTYLRRLREDRAYRATLQYPTTDAPYDQVLGGFTNSTEFTTDTYGDLMLGSSKTVSQAQWATAHKTSAGYLFGPWTGLFYERKRKEEAYEERCCGKPLFLSRMEPSWGFDRFGCVSDLG